MLDEIHQGDCLELMRRLPDASVDAIVSDPPSAIGFMSAKWDSDKGGRKQWCAYMEERFAEALRVCKPGAHALVWALPRTSHWTATALEDAGWEIRDVCCHLFGSGFPKSLDIGKKIDEMAGAERETGEPVIHAGSVRKPQNYIKMGYGRGTDSSSYTSAPATPDAEQWDGWGTNLKPSHEHWILCRKPVENTIAQNVLTHGVGGINIDACRVDYVSDYDKKHQEDIARGQETATNGRMFGSSTTKSEASSLVMKGRWPSNLVFSHLPECSASACADGCAVAELDEQGGIRKSGARKSHHKFGGVFGNGKNNSPKCQATEGTASRFFPNFHYFAKASPNDRSCNKAVENNHPTVKNRDLMRWLVRLITPPGGVVLDMFGGSGSTAIACIEEGVNYILLEQEPEFVAIAKARVAAVLGETEPSLSDRVAWLETQVKVQSKKIKKLESGQLSLFEQMEIAS